LQCCEVGGHNASACCPRTCTPETVKYGISNFTVIGFFIVAWGGPESEAPMEGKPKCARSRNSFCPGNCLMLQGRGGGGA